VNRSYLQPSSTPPLTTVVARLLQMAPIALAQTKHLLDQAFTVTFAKRSRRGRAQVVN